MIDVRHQVDCAFQELIRFLETTPFSKDVAFIDSLKNSIDNPSSLAIAGQVKTGKSSFLNALLGEDLALVGTTETTATVTTFRYGRPPDIDRPVRCAWTDGRTTWESRHFLDSLQGNTIDALRRANDILRIEYFIENPVLANNVMIVDTPGSHAVVDDDVHEQRTAEYFALSNALRGRHDRETISLSSTADAIVYLTSCVIASDDSAFISEFQGRVRQTATGNASAANIIVLISRADLSSELMGTSQERAKYIAIEERRLSEQLQTPVTVLAVSSQLKDVLAHFKDNELEQLAVRLKDAFPSPADLDFVLAGNDNDFCGEDFECALSPEDRRKILHRFERYSWNVVKIVFKTLHASESTKEAQLAIAQKSGFPEIQALLKKFFFARANMLRCNTVIQSALSYLDSLRVSNRTGVGALRNRKKELEDQFLPFVTQLKSSVGGYLPESAREEEFGGIAVKDIVEKLQLFLLEEIERIPDADGYTEKIGELYENFASIDRSLDMERLRYEGLMLFDNYPSVCVSNEERIELGRLLNSPHAMDSSYAASRQLYWRSQMCLGVRKRLADIVMEIYERSMKTEAK